MQSKVVALYAPVPVAVHMWFADGAGWAYHPDINDEVLEEIIRTVTPILYSSESESRVARECRAGLLVVDKIRQENCADPSAIGRSPHMLRVALLCQPVRDTWAEPDDKRLCDDLSRQFNNLPSPTKRGQCESLIVWAKAESASTASPTPEMVEQPMASPLQAPDHELAKENSLLKQEIADLRHQDEYLRRIIPTQRQRLVTAITIALVSALLTAAAIYVAAVMSGVQ